MPATAPDRILDRKGRRLVVAGGGTGGHLFPGIAVAQAFSTRHADNQVLFINAGRPLDIRVLSDGGWPYRTIATQGIKGRSLWRQLGAVAAIPGAYRTAVRILASFSPDVVFGVGGYSAGPVVLAASRLGLTTALHEQNQLPGVTNRILGRFVDRIYLSFADDAGRFAAHKVVISGNPVRGELLAAGRTAADPTNRRGFTVLVVGGSQGAHAINAAMVDALPRLKAQTGLRVIHQTGARDEAWVAESYAQAGLNADVRAFFDQMAEPYRQTDLIVCRAGATTVAEITIVGKAAIFVPFPFAADDHQTRNAQALVEAGAAEMIAQKDLNGDRLADTIIGYARNRPELTRMAAKARALGRPEAAETIVDDLHRLMTSPRGGKNEKQEPGAGSQK